ncbi:MAG: hypothetical protein E6G57_03045 [Actinobacteria bacterium]|nr:MAG: hypothetical protein E6G57_03045 [Actinomycetota bacterium]
MESGRIADLGRARWGGERHRLEVWYATFTDAASGDGYWLHHEVVAPVDADARPYAHGWLSVFPTDGAPNTQRFGPSPPGDKGWFSAGDVLVEDGLLRGPQWDLTFTDGARPLYTFPKLAWDRELLPAAQIVPCPTATFSGRVNDTRIDAARGALARIYGHGSAERWAWLHADLGDGDAVEIVAAAPRRRGPLSLRPMPVVRLRVDGEDWPNANLTNAITGRARVDLPRWTVTVRSRRRRLRASVLIPPERSVVLTYVDPDGSTCTCTNSERASAELTLEAYDGGWRTERQWTLDRTAHAEVGTRP